MWHCISDVSQVVQRSFSSTLCGKRQALVPVLMVHLRMPIENPCRFTPHPSHEGRTAQFACRTNYGRAFSSFPLNTMSDNRHLQKSLTQFTEKPFGWLGKGVFYYKMSYRCLQDSTNTLSSDVYEMFRDMFLQISWTSTNRPERRQQFSKNVDKKYLRLGWCIILWLCKISSRRFPGTSWIPARRLGAGTASNHFRAL